MAARPSHIAFHMAEMGLIITEEVKANVRQNIGLKFAAFAAPRLCIP